MNFPRALEMLFSGEKLTRTGWNGKDMYIYQVPGSVFNVNRPPLLGIYPEGTEIKYHPHVDMKTVDGSCVPWTPSQQDIFATDWQIVG